MVAVRRRRGHRCAELVRFRTAKKPIGITTRSRTLPPLGQRFAPKASGVNAYLAKNEEVPKLDWEWMLAAGVARRQLAQLARIGRSRASARARSSGHRGSVVEPPRATPARSSAARS